MKKIVLLLLVFMCGCRSIGATDVIVAQNHNPNQLVKLDAMISKSNLENVYRTWKGDRHNYGIPGDYVKAASMGHEKHIIAETVSIFEQEVNNIVSQSGESKGELRLTVGPRSTRANIPLRIFTIVGLKIPCLFGVPSNVLTDELTVRVDVVNKAGKMVETYETTVRSSEAQAMYWGYSGRNTYRKIAIENIKKAMEEIREEINADAKKINAKL